MIFKKTVYSLFMTLVLSLGVGFADTNMAQTPNVMENVPEDSLSDGAIKNKEIDNEKLAKKVRTVSGHVKAIKQIRLPGENDANMVVKIKTKKGNKELILDLGDASVFTGDKLTKESMITAKGRVVKVGSYKILVVNHLHINGNHIEVDRTKEMKMFQQASSDSSKDS